MYKNHFKNFIKWIPATTHEQISETKYFINIHNFVRFVHKNQLRISKLSDKFHPLLTNELLTLTKSNNTNTDEKKL